VDPSRQGFVVRNHQGGPVQVPDHIGHGEGFPRARHSEQGLEIRAAAELVHDAIDGLGLIARGLIGSGQAEGGHGEESTSESVLCRRAFGDGGRAEKREERAASPEEFVRAS
jgi:hypothetical protein